MFCGIFIFLNIILTNHILQWICRSVKVYFEELNFLIIENKPVAICLQETFLKDSDRLKLKYHSCYFPNCSDNDKASGGVFMIVNNSVPHRSFRLDSTLQAVAVSVSHNRLVSFMPMMDNEQRSRTVVSSVLGNYICYRDAPYLNLFRDNPPPLMCYTAFNNSTIISRHSSLFKSSRFFTSTKSGCFNALLNDITTSVALERVKTKYLITSVNNIDYAALNPQKIGRYCFITWFSRGRVPPKL